MKIRINDRPDIQEIEVIINCVADDPLVNKIISALNTVDAKLLCRRQGETFQLGLADIPGANRAAVGLPQPMGRN